MTTRTRKLVGTIALMLFIAVYALVAMGVIATVFPQMPRWALPFLYALAGVLWVPFAGLIVTWMHRGKPDPEPTET